MTLLTFFALVFSGSFLIHLAFGGRLRSDGLEVSAFVVGVLLIGLALSIPLVSIQNIDQIQRFRAIEETAEAGRDGEHLIEGAAYRTEIAEANAWLRSAQYWNKTLIGPWIPNEVEDMEPIR